MRSRIGKVSTNDATAANDPSSRPRSSKISSQTSAGDPLVKHPLEAAGAIDRSSKFSRSTINIAAMFESETARMAFATHPAHLTA
jgi:hypothetical protein